MSESGNDDASSSSTTATRRVGRVERWLSKGYGFVIDMGKLNVDDTGNVYGWTKDEMTGEKVFIYHSDLRSPRDDVFHRLFANEYVEYTIDPALPKRNERYQGFDVSGLDGSELLCDLNAAATDTSNTGNTNTTRTRTKKQQAPQANFVPPPNATVVYYVPQSVPQSAPPQVAPTSFPAVQATNASSPDYVMPTGGIPIPK